MNYFVCLLVGLAKNNHVFTTIRLPYKIYETTLAFKYFGLILTNY